MSSKLQPTSMWYHLLMPFFLYTIKSATSEETLSLVTHRIKNISLFQTLLLRYPTRRQFAYMANAHLMNTVLLAKVLAESRNATLLLSTGTNPEPTTSMAYMYATNDQDMSRLSLGKLLASYNGRLAIYPVFPQGYQFLLCDEVREQQESIFLTQLILQTADIYTWSGFVISLICMLVGT